MYALIVLWTLHLSNCSLVCMGSAICLGVSDHQTASRTFHSAEQPDPEQDSPITSNTSPSLTSPFARGTIPSPHINA